MSEREMRQAAVLAQVKSGTWTLAEAAERMDLSYRQSKRLWKRYQKHGAVGMAHGSAGRRSNRAKPKKVRTKTVRLIRQKYSGEVGKRFGPTPKYGDRGAVARGWEGRGERRAHNAGNG